MGHISKRDRDIAHRQKCSYYYRKVCENYAFMNDFEIDEEDGIIYKDDVEFINDSKFKRWWKAWLKLKEEDQTGFDFYFGLK